MHNYWPGRNVTLSSLKSELPLAVLKVTTRTLYVLTFLMNPRKYIIISIKHIFTIHLASEAVKKLLHTLLENKFKT